MHLKRVTGSYRDPGGSVYQDENNKIFRTVNASRAADYEKLLTANIIQQSIDAGFLVPTQETTDEPLIQQLNASYLLQHKRIPAISYPYEWTFHELKKAALHHLEFHLFLLERDFTLSDATAFNIQFIGHKPIFIDLLSIVPYQDGDLWVGYKQFCEQFLNPLLLTSLKGIHFNSWYRGTLDGISTRDLLSTLSLKQRLNWRIFTFLALHQNAENKVVEDPKDVHKKLTKKRKGISKKSYMAMLSQLYSWINKLEPKIEKSAWQDYARENTYERLERDSKADLVRNFVARNQLKTLVDLGCNTGDYSLAALQGGSEYVLGFDFDHQALAEAYRRAVNENVNFLPLWLDASNPSPAQGWRESERESFSQRFRADGVIALAFEHHLAIAKNIPLSQAIDWIVSIAEHGLIEFVPKDDPTIIEMLSSRADIFPNYDQSEFEAALTRSATIVNTNITSKSGRILYEYKKV